MVEQENLTVLYQDEHLIAVDKPSGLLVHRSEVDRRETRFAMQQVRDHIGMRVYPVHRLDKPTSGVLLFALHREAARKLTALFQENRVRKTYMAVVRGYTEPQGTIDYALKEQLDKMTDSRADKDKAPQSAITLYRRCQTIELPFSVGKHDTTRYSLLQICPHTGRKHQIRRHMKHIFHPIIGDTTHGDGRHNQFFRTEFHCRQLLLAATELYLPHPYTHRKLNLYTRPGTDFMKILNHFQWPLPAHAISGEAADQWA